MKYIGTDIAKRAINNIDNSSNENINGKLQSDKNKEDNNNGAIVQQKEKRGRPRKKDWRWI